MPPKNYSVHYRKTVPAFSTAALTAIAPNLGAGTLHRVLRKDPIGVRTALTITTSCVDGMRKAHSDI